MIQRPGQFISRVSRKGASVRYVRAVAEGTGSVAGIIHMFPSCFGIQGLMALVAAPVFILALLLLPI